MGGASASVSIGLSFELWKQPQQPFDLGDRLTAQFKEQLDKLVNDGYLDNCSECQPDQALEDIIEKEHLIVTFSAPVSVCYGSSQ